MAIADAHAVGGAPGAELNILGQREEIPAAQPPQQRSGESEARSGDGAGGPQQHPGLIQVGGIVEIPDAVAGGQPVITKILGVPVAGEGLVAVGDNFIHLAYVIGLQQVVRIENQEIVEAVQAHRGLDLVQQVVHGVALANLQLVEPLKNRCTMFPGHPGSFIRAVVGHNKNMYQLPWVILGIDGVQQVGEDCFLIPGGDEDSVPVLLFRGVLAPLDQEGDDQIQNLIKKANRRQGHQDQADGGKQSDQWLCWHNENSFSLLLAPIIAIFRFLSSGGTDKSC